MDIFFDPNNDKENIGWYHVFMEEPYKTYARQRNMQLRESTTRKGNAVFNVKAALDETIPAAIDNAVRQAAKENPNITITG